MNVRKPNIRITPKSEQKVFPFPGVFERPKSERFSSDFGRSTSLDRFQYIHISKIYIKRSSLLSQLSFRFQTYNFVPNPKVFVQILDVFIQQNIWEWDQSCRTEIQTSLDFGRWLYVVINYLKTGQVNVLIGAISAGHLGSKYVRRIHKFFKYIYEIIHSRLEWKYSLHTKIAWKVLYHITRKVEECISMCINVNSINMCNYLASNQIVMFQYL